MDILNVPGLTGWSGVILSILSILVYGYWTNKNVKSKVEEGSKEAQQKAENIAKEAYKSAIDTMQVEIGVLRIRVEEAEKNNKRHEHIIEGIRSLLRKNGIIITIDGDIVSIDVDNKRSTIISIKENDGEK